MFSPAVGTWPLVVLRSRTPTCTNRLPMLKDCVHRATFLQRFVDLDPEAAHFRFFHKLYAKHHIGILWKKQSLNSIIMGNIVLNKILHSYDFLASLFNFCRTQSSCQMIRSLGVPPREDLLVSTGTWVGLVYLSWNSVVGLGRQNCSLHFIVKFWVSDRISQNTSEYSTFYTQ